MSLVQHTSSVLPTNQRSSRHGAVHERRARPARQQPHRRRKPKEVRALTIFPRSSSAMRSPSMLLAVSTKRRRSAGSGSARTPPGVVMSSTRADSLPRTCWGAGAGCRRVGCRRVQLS